MHRTLIALSLALLLTGCGGMRAPEPPPHDAAQGVYFSGLHNPLVTAIVMPDGRFYAPFVSLGYHWSGMAVGHGSSSFNTFTGSYQHIGDPNLYSGTINATFDPGSSFNATLSENGNDLSVYGIVFPPELYTFDTPASMPTIVRHYIGGVIGSHCGDLIVVSPDGTITGTSNNYDTELACDFSGTFSPDPNHNFFTVTLTFSPGTGPLQGQTATGILVFYPYPVLFVGASNIPEFAIILPSPDAAALLMGIQSPNYPGGSERSRPQPSSTLP